MKSNRRDFLKFTGLAGLAGLMGWSCQTDNNRQASAGRSQIFNMSGYAAPGLDLVRIGIIGLGSRGTGTARRLARIEGLEIKAICDLVPGKLNNAADILGEYGHQPDKYSDGEDDWKRMCERDDIDLIYICTPWHLHAPQAVFAMEHDKHVATEIPAAVTIEECWQLVETSERTRKHCLQLTNVCYGTFEMVTLNMARKGFLGDIIHGDGAYIHQLIENKFSKENYENMWRLNENANRNGNLYPHHGLGTIAQMMDINHGDKMEFMVSVSSNDFMMADKARERAAVDPFYEPYVNKQFRGNMNSSIIRTHRGRTIMLQHDVTSPRPYSRIHQVSGTLGIVKRYPEPMVATGHDGWLPKEELEPLVEQYTPEIDKRVGDMARQVGGHGGMDTLLNWRLIDCLRNGLPLDMNVYDAALWSAIGPLSEWSVANGSQPVDIPDFTNGSWETNSPGMDINLERGGNTRVI